MSLKPAVAAVASTFRSGVLQHIAAYDRGAAHARAGLPWKRPANAEEILDYSLGYRSVLIAGAAANCSRNRERAP